MLCSLTIRNLAVVESLELEFEKGLTVLTGETGAGKSILLTALGLALGGRADPSYIRPGNGRAEIHLEFDVADARSAYQWLKGQELDEDKHCLIRRIISTDGRSKAFINNRPTTLQSLQTLSRTLIEIHGQHAHLTLLKNSEQQRLLDDFANNGALLNDVNVLFNRWDSTRKELERQIDAANEQSAQEELLRYQIQELEQIGVEALDYSALIEEHSLQANLGNILNTGQSQLEQLYENEQHSVYALLNQSIQAFSELSRITPELNEISELLNDAQIQVREAGQQLRWKLESLESDPQRLNWLEEQLSTIHALARKHHVKPERLPEHLEEQRRTLQTIAHRSDQIEELEAAIDQTLTAYHEQAKQLSSRRHEYAHSLQKKVSDIIKTLGMAQGEFFIEVTTHSGNDPQPGGCDQIDFRVTTNPGMPPRPLAKIASGGELSRIGLAIQVAATGRKSTPTMIFDEVDAGIGGGIAEIVGKQLRTLGSDRQVLCVTHLPQVAAQSHRHLLVEKTSTADSTHTLVRPLSRKERREEIARMLGGVKITQNTLAHAEEMLRCAVER
jgi:DNA repair protein RecN (Recombination protein N)